MTSDRHSRCLQIVRNARKATASLVEEGKVKDDRSHVGLTPAQLYACLYRRERAVFR